MKSDSLNTSFSRIKAQMRRQGIAVLLLRSAALVVGECSYK